MKKNWHKHYGIYGIAIKDKEILLINKRKGPYINRFDLPGGSLREDESLLEHLKREFIEETGYEIKILGLVNIQDYKINEPYFDCEYIHHIAIFYLVELTNKVGQVSYIINVNGSSEINDSAGICWKNIDELSDKNSSPLVMSVVSFIENQKINISETKNIIAFDNNSI